MDTQGSDSRHLRVHSLASSRSNSRPRSSRHSSTRSVPYLPGGPEALLYPEGAVSEETVGFLREFVRPHHRNNAKRRADTEDTYVDEAHGFPEDEGGPLLPEEGQDRVDNEDDDRPLDEESWEDVKKKPWYRRPSPWWLICGMPFSAIAMSACAAPRIEIYTQLACRMHKPEYVDDRKQPIGDFRLLTRAPSKIFQLDERIIYGNETSYKPNYLRLGASDSESESDEDKQQKCAADPVVQAEVAKLIAVLTTTMGVLACLTTGYWGSFSDRYGRLRVMGISIVGLLITDVNFILVYYFSSLLPGGYWFLLLGPFIEGLMGGLTSSIAAMHSYIADCTEPHARSRTLSLSMGLLFIGMAFGPTIGSLVVRATPSIGAISVFYMATAAHFLFALSVWFLVPESLPLRVRKNNRVRYAVKLREKREKEAQADEGRVIVGLRKAFAFLTPLAVFAPEKISQESGALVTSDKCKTHRDWSLTLLAIGYGFTAFIMSSYQFKFQFAAATFGWTSQELGYFLSIVGATRAFYLTVILPIASKLINRTHSEKPIRLPASPSPSRVPSRSPSPMPPSHSRSEGTATLKKQPPHSLRFDLGLARVSLLIEVVAYALIPTLGTRSPMAFVSFSILASCGGGFGPAVQALALALFAARGRAEKRRLQALARGTENAEETPEPEEETGRLYGAMSVVQALCSQILGPTIFGITYARTAGTHPSAIFVLSAVFASISLACVLFLRLPAHAHHEPVVPIRGGERDLSVDDERAGLLRETTLVELEDGEEDGRKIGARSTI